jgi:formylglycine-generating enzyme required for sulfatase activity/predicted Ser/Thr protein kinase/dienelactone hydrolase
VGPAIGQRISHYRVISELGTGGMGVVYLAEDTGLNRKVALKFLKPDALQNAEAEARLIREARAASALDHPNIATIYEVGEWNGQHFIAMAYYDGETLAARLAHGPLPIPETIRLTRQIASALARAHGLGIVHRDLKPANIMVAQDGSVKILDFGLATQGLVEGPTEARLTLTGTTLGTVSYMSPEQALGAHVDRRTDIWAMGVIAFQMSTGRVPFTGNHPAAILHSIIYDPAPDLKSVQAAVPDALCRIVAKALAKDAAARYQSADEMATALDALQSATAIGAEQRLTLLRKPAVAVPVALAAILIAVFATRLVMQTRNERWARDVAIPEVSRLIDAEQFVAAFDLAQRADALAPGDPILARLLPLVVRTPAIRSDPSGAIVSYKDYRAPNAAWRTLGTTPIAPAKVPAGYYRWRIEKAGFEPIEGAGQTGPPPPAPQSVLTFTLPPTGSTPPSMVLVPGSTDPYSLYLPGFEHLAPVRLTEPFWIDRYEVTNEQFKAFVDGGGYQKREYWQEPFVEAGRTLSWDAALARFRDGTGRPGPATWVQGEYPSGQGTFPVSGVSWYEAAAYARFAHKQLPTIYHWTKAAEPRSSVWVVPFSNFDGTGTVAVGSRHALHPFGTYDMAGNVKEWVQNDSGDGRRYILGGSWDEPTYVFNEPDARSPFERAKTFGFRLAKYVGDPQGALAATVVWPTRDYSKEKPASDQVFQVYRRLYAYDRKPFRADVQSVDDSDESWHREQITFPAPYGNEQMKVFLYLPKKFLPPYQTVVYFPGAGLLRARSFDQLPVRAFDFIIKSGRAVALPVFKGTFDRKTEIDDSTANPSLLYRDHVIMWIKDFSRSVDYLQTRTDLSLDRLALVGLSWGGRMGSIIPAIDDRVKVEVLIIGGFSMQRSQPEVDQINFASRVKVPVLMLNGRYDFFFPIDASQKPMFETLATPKEDKRHLLFEGGHGLPRLDMIKETLDWLDHYQGVPSGR